MSRRARVALRTAAFVLAGAVLTVGVAWGVALLAVPPSLSRTDERAWVLPTASGWPSQCDATERGSSLALTAVWQFAWADGSSRPVFRQSVVSFGLPMRGLAIQFRAVGMEYDSRSLAIPTLAGDTYLLPLVPLWPGFALDTFFYGSLVFLVWSVPAVIRRRVRTRRGRCPACGYDLKGLPRCPECGRS